MARQVFRGGLIDEPDAFGPVEAWEQHLAMIEAMEFADDAIPSKDSLVRHARERIADLKAFERQHGQPE